MEKKSEEKSKRMYAKFFEQSHWKNINLSAYIIISSFQFIFSTMPKNISDNQIVDSSKMNKILILEHWINENNDKKFQLGSDYEKLIVNRFQFG